MPVWSGAGGVVRVVADARPEVGQASFAGTFPFIDMCEGIGK